MRVLVYSCCCDYWRRINAPPHSHALRRRWPSERAALDGVGFVFAVEEYLRPALDGGQPVEALTPWSVDFLRAANHARTIPA